MQIGTQLRRALDAAHHLDDVAAPWTEVLEGFAQLTGADSATFVMFDGAGELLVFALHGGDAQAQRDYVEHFHAHDIMNPLARGCPAGIWLDSAEVYSPAALSRNMFYADFMRAHRMLQMLAYMVVVSPERRGGICVQRSSIHSKMRALTGSAQMLSLTTAAQQAMARQRERLQFALATLESGFSAYGEAVFLVSRSGSLVHASDAAQAWLASPGALVLRDGRLQHREPARQAAWLAALRKAALGPGTVVQGLPVGPGCAHRLELVRADPAMGLAGETLVLVRVTRKRSAAQLPQELLRAAFGLTVAEASVLAALAAGLRPREYALQQGVAISTVRTQLSSLMDKMGCARQADLVRKACALA